MKGAVKHERANRVFSAPTVAWRSPGRPGAQAEACGLPPRPRSTKTTATNAGSVSAARPFFSPTPPRRAQEPSARPHPRPALGPSAYREDGAREETASPTAGPCRDAEATAAKQRTTVRSPSLHKMAPELLRRRGEGPAPAPLPGAFLLAGTFLAPAPN